MKEENETDLGMTSEQIRAVIYSVARGRDLQSLHPEIVDDYRRGLTLLDIAKKYSINSEAPNDSTSIGIVKHALMGNENPFFGEVYGGLMDLVEYAHMSRNHQADNAIRNAEKQRVMRTGIFGMTREELRRAASIAGKNVYKKGIGMFGMSPKRRRAINSANGKKTGKRAKELGIGIHELTLEQRKAQARSAVISRGQVPWKKEEILYASQLTQQEDFKYKGGIYVKKIAEMLNEKYHNSKNVRSSASVQSALRRSRL